VWIGSLITHICVQPGPALGIYCHWLCSQTNCFLQQQNIRNTCFFPILMVKCLTLTVLSTPEVFIYIISLQSQLFTLQKSNLISALTVWEWCENDGTKLGYTIIRLKDVLWLSYLNSLFPFLYAAWISHAGNWSAKLIVTARNFSFSYKDLKIQFMHPDCFEPQKSTYFTIFTFCYGIMSMVLISVYGKLNEFS
jgi:hypothetical protein